MLGAGEPSIVHVGLNKKFASYQIKDPPRGGICGFLCLAEDATFRPRGHAASWPSQWAVEDEEQGKLSSDVIVTDCEI